MQLNQLVTYEALSMVCFGTDGQCQPASAVGQEVLSGAAAFSRAFVPCVTFLLSDHTFAP